MINRSRLLINNRYAKTFLQTFKMSLAGELFDL